MHNQPIFSHEFQGVKMEINMEAKRPGCNSEKNGTDLTDLWIIEQTIL